MGDPPAVTDEDLVGPALEAEDLYGHTARTTTFAPTVRRLADLAPTTLACMHGASFHGDGAALVRSLADAYERRFAVEAAARGRQ